MQDYTQLYLDYINGSLDSGKEMELFSLMAADSSMRNDFRCCVAIEKEFKKEQEGIMPSAAVTSSIFAGLGLKLPLDNEPAPIAAKTVAKSKIFIGIMSGAICTVITILLMLSLNDKQTVKKENNSLNSNNINKGISEIPKIRSIETKAIHSGSISAIYKNRKNAFLAHSNEEEFIENNTLNNNIFGKTDFHVNQLEYTSAIEQDYLKNTRIVGERLASLRINPGEPSLRDNYKFSFILHGTGNYNIAGSGGFNSNPNLNNFGLCLLYNISPYFSAGFDIRKEDFVIRQYSGISSSDDINETMLNSVDYGIVMRINNNSVNVNPFGQISFTGNSTGTILRVISGIEYRLFSGFDLTAGVEYSDLFYNNRNQIWDSKKLGIGLGIKYSIY